MVTGDRSRLAFALRTLVGNMLARDTGSVSVDLRDVGGQAKLALSAPEIPPTTENATPEDVVRAEALEAATHARQRASGPGRAGGGLDRPGRVPPASAAGTRFGDTVATLLFICDDSKMQLMVNGTIDDLIEPANALRELRPFTTLIARRHGSRTGRRTGRRRLLC
jgi:hypothetical protein